MIELSKGVFVVDVKKFTEVYEARCESVFVLSDGVKERMELYLKLKENDRNSFDNKQR